MATFHKPSALAHISVLDLTGPEGNLCGKILADLGADVTKIEPPDGDKSRKIGPFATGVNQPDFSLYFANYNTNKYSVMLDLESREGVNRFIELSEKVDVIIENFRPGYMNQIGIGFERLSLNNPGIVMASISPFGQTGPYSSFIGDELIVQAMGGVMYCQGDEMKPPCVAPCEQISQLASFHTATGVLAAINHRNFAGKGQCIDVSMYEIAAQLLFNITRYTYHGDIARRMGATPIIAPNGHYACSDGYISLAVLENSHWQELVRWMDNESLADPIWNDMNFRRSQPEVVDIFVRDFIAGFTVEDFLEQAYSRHLAVSRVNEISDIAQSSQLEGRNYFQEIIDPEIGAHLVPGPPYRFGLTPSVLERPAPRLGEHQERVIEKTKTEPGDSIETNDPLSDDLAFPLQGIRILDLSRVWSGPFSTRYLGDLGADVIKVETNKHLDTGRIVTNSTPQFLEINRNKKSITLDFAGPEGVKLIKELVQISDVVVENFASGVLDRRGLGYEALKKEKPDLVMISMPGYGREGPKADHVGYGQSLMSYAGLSNLWGFPDSPVEKRSNVHFPDFVSAGATATAILAALEYRNQYRFGQHVEIAQVEAMTGSMGVALLDYFVNGESWDPVGNRNFERAPNGCYPCRGEDQWCVISCPNDNEWDALVKVMGDPVWAQGSKFDSQQNRFTNHDELDNKIGEWTVNFVSYDLMNMLQEHLIPAGVVQTGEQLRNDPHLRERDFIVSVDHSEWGAVEHPGIAIKFSDTPGQITRGVPKLGEHNNEIYTKLLGIPEGAVNQLVEKEVIA